MSYFRYKYMQSDEIWLDIKDTGTEITFSIPKAIIKDNPFVENSEWSLKIKGKKFIIEPMY